MGFNLLPHQWTRYLIYTFLCFATGLVYTIFLAGSFTPIPRIGRSPGVFGSSIRKAKLEFLIDGKRLLDEGYARFKDFMFTVQTADVCRIVLSTKYLEELRALPESILSHRESVSARFLGYWSGLDVVRQSPLHNEVCQTTLVQNLPSLVSAMHDEAKMAIHESIGDLAAGMEIALNPYKSVYNTIARINSRVLVGLPLCRDRDWLLVSEGYPQDSVAVATSLRAWPWALRPFVYPFLKPASRLRKEYAIAHSKLNPLIEERKAVIQKNGTQNILGWMIDQARGNDSKPKNIIGKILFLTMASFHASTTAAVHVLYDLCAHPEYFEPLREEIKAELEAQGGEWSNSVLNRLKRLDSVIKESQRMNAPGLCQFTSHSYKF